MEEGRVHLQTSLVWGAPNIGRGEVETRGIEAPEWHLGDGRPKFLRGASRAHAKGSALGGSVGRESNPTA